MSINSNLLKKNLSNVQNEIQIFNEKYKDDILKLNREKSFQKIYVINKILKENLKLQKEVKVLKENNEYLKSENNKKIKIIKNMKLYINNKYCYLKNRFYIGKLWS